MYKKIQFEIIYRNNESIQGAPLLNEEIIVLAETYCPV